MSFTKNLSATLSTLAMLLLLLLSTSDLGAAQSQSGRSFPDPSSSKPASDDEQERMGTPQREFAHRALIARAEAEHKQNTKRVNEGAALASELHAALVQHHSLSSAQIKSLEQLEKLTRRIRGYAGGSDDGAEAVDLPATPIAALARVNEIYSQLQKEAERTSRQVISTKIISSSNEALALIRYVRSLLRP